METLGTVTLRSAHIETGLSVREEESQGLKGQGSRAQVVIINTDGVMRKCNIFINSCILHVIPSYLLKVTHKWLSQDLNPA